MITLGPELEAAIRTEGEKAYPNECCGIILGTLVPGQLSIEGPAGAEQYHRLAEGIIPIANAREAEEQYHRFQIEPEDLMKAELEARRQKREVLGFYHSHPDHPARPSEFDREYALPFYSYIIVGVEQAKAKDFRSWELRPDRSAFEEEEINFLHT
jgi:proteasome lid subunit RPN8/RPN11